MKYFTKFVNILFKFIIIILFSTQLSFAKSKINSNIDFYNSNNEPLNIEKFDDNIVILHFWATWCQTCIAELHSLDLLQKDYKKQPLKVIALSEDYKGVEVVNSFFKEHTIKNLEAYWDKKNSLFQDLRIQAVPSTIIIDKNGFEIERYVGEVNWDSEEIRKTLDDLLK